MFKNNQAVIVVDMQVDFCEGGVLGIEGTIPLIKNINNFIQDAVDKKTFIIFSRDVHPVNHSSFIENGGKWLKHCVEDSIGAELHPELFIPKMSILVSKGTQPDQEAYSAFKETYLEQTLQSLQVKEVIVIGVALDYCVQYTAIDSQANGFSTTVITSLTRAVDSSLSNIQKILKNLQANGIRII